MTGIEGQVIGTIANDVINEGNGFDEFIARVGNKNYDIKELTDIWDYAVTQHVESAVRSIKVVTRMTRERIDKLRNEWPATEEKIKEILDYYGFTEIDQKA